MNFKILALVLIFTACVFPFKIFGYFATPDKYVHSESFSAQGSKATVQIPSVQPIILEHANNGEKEILKNSLPLAVSLKKDDSSKSIAQFLFILLLLFIIIFSVLIFTHKSKNL